MKQNGKARKNGSAMYEAPMCFISVTLQKTEFAKMTRVALYSRLQIRI